MSLSRRARIDVGIAGPCLRFADLVAHEADHPPEPVAVGAGSQLEALAQVVAQDDVPAPEELRGQKVSEAAISPLLTLLLPGQVVNVAVQDKKTGCPGEVLLGEFAGPAWKPGHDRAATLSRQRGARSTALSLLGVGVATVNSSLALHRRSAHCR